MWRFMGFVPIFGRGAIDWGFPSPTIIRQRFKLHESPYFSHLQDICGDPYELETVEKLEIGSKTEVQKHGDSWDPHPFPEGGC